MMTVVLGIDGEVGGKRELVDSFERLLLLLTSLVGRSSCMPMSSEVAISLGTEAGLGSHHSRISPSRDFAACLVWTHRLFVW